MYILRVPCTLIGTLKILEYVTKSMYFQGFCIFTNMVTFEITGNIRRLHTFLRA